MDKTRFIREDIVSNPEDLPGVKKKSFVLPFRGGEIWFEHLDGMYQYTELVLQKLKRDGEKFLLPSKPGLIGFVMDETVIDQRVIDEIVNMLCNSQKRYMRVAFIGTNREIKKSLKKALKTSEFMFHFFDDLEAAKEWLVS